jgi:hypothetical protein
VSSPHVTHLTPTNAPDPATHKIVYGGDPEFFLFGGVPGRRRFLAPHAAGIPPAGMKLWRDGDGGIFRDGFAIELNPLPTSAPHLLHYRAGNLRRYCENTMLAQAKLTQEWRGSRGPEPARVLMPVPWVRVQPKGCPPDMLTLGCSPTLNAYGETAMSKRINPMTYPFRSSGGHIHLTTPAARGLGYPILQDTSLYPFIVRIFDKLIGQALTYIFEEGRKRPFARRTLYGRAGEYRIQRHGAFMGLEYRVPGPEIWASVNSNPFATICELMEWVVSGPGFSRFVDEVWDVGACAPTRNYINIGLRPMNYPGNPILSRLRLEHYRAEAPTWLYGVSR